MRDCNEEDIAILRDGVFVHEAEAICRRLEKAGIQFGVRQVSQEDAGIVDPRKDNWASGLCTVVNYFNRGGLSVYVRICVRSEDVERANEILAERPRKPMDAITVVVLIVVALAVFLFAYSFIDPHRKKDLSLSTYLID